MPDLRYPCSWVPAPVCTLLNFWNIKLSARKHFEGQRKTIYCLQKIIFCKNDYNSAENTKSFATSNFNSSANSGLLMTNNGALELWHQGEFVFCHLAGGRNNHKKWLFVEGKQTVEPDTWIDVQIFSRGWQESDKTQKSTITVSFYVLRYSEHATKFCWLQTIKTVSSAIFLHPAFNQAM